MLSFYFYEVVDIFGEVLKEGVSSEPSIVINGIEIDFNNIEYSQQTYKNIIITFEKIQIDKFKLLDLSRKGKL